MTKLNNNCSPLFGSVWSNCESRYSQLQSIYYFGLTKSHLRECTLYGRYPLLYYKIN
nr:MAG TPA: hypothetical protein [Bacteriophage sp.]